MQPTNEVFDKLIAPLYMQLSVSSRLYKLYLEEKIFGNAEALRVSNKKIVQLVMDQFKLVPVELNADVLDLISHYEHWFSEFRDHKKKVHPGPADRFVFNPSAGHVPFPFNAEKKIREYYEKMKKEQEKSMA
jgi:hypothetical protein